MKNFAHILSQGESLPSLTGILEELHRVVMGLVWQKH